MFGFLRAYCCSVFPLFIFLCNLALIALTSTNASGEVRQNNTKLMKSAPPERSDTETGILESPRALWARSVITHSMKWEVAPVDPTTLFDVLAAASPSKPLVFLLKAGHYIISKQLVITRSAPWVLKAEEAGVFFEAPHLSCIQGEEDSFSSSRAMVCVEGSSDVVMQGVTFASGIPDVSCLHVGGGRLCLAECKFSCSLLTKPALSHPLQGAAASCVQASSMVSAMFFSQCEFTSGALGLRIATDDDQQAVTAAPASSRATDLKSLQPMVVVLEDCGFGLAESPRDGSPPSAMHDDGQAAILDNGILIACRRAVNVHVDHSSFDNVRVSSIETTAHHHSAESTKITLQHSTFTGCGRQQGTLFVMRGYSSLDVLDCTLEQCGVMLLCHATTCRIVESSFVSDDLAAAPAGGQQRFFSRCVLAQDHANLVVERCEWAYHWQARGASAAPWAHSFLTLLSNGRIVIDGNLFQLKRSQESSSEPLRSEDAVLSSIVIDGTSAPAITNNRFDHVDITSSSSSAGTTPSECSAGVFCGVLLGLWHDANIQNNTFGGCIRTEATYCSLEDYGGGSILAQKNVEAIIEEWEASPRAAGSEKVQRTPKANSKETSSAPPPNGSTNFLALPPRASTSMTFHSKQHKPQPKRKNHNPRSDGTHDEGRERLPAKKPAPSADAAAQPDGPRKHADEDIPNDDGQSGDDSDPTDAATIAKLKDQVAALKQQLEAARTSATMTNTVAQPISARPPSTKRPTSARPTSAKPSPSTSRPTSAKSSLVHSRSMSRQRGKGVDGEVDTPQEKMVRIGEYDWNMTRMKSFMQGRLPLAQVRRAAAHPDEHGHQSPKRSNSPTAIYDAWKREQSDKRQAEERALRKIKEEEDVQRRRLTPRQQDAMVHRIHTESIEHQKEVRAFWEAEAMCKLQRPRFATMKRADAVAEAEGDFEERLAKDMKDRKLRREILMKKYVPEQASQRRSRSEIESYASSMHKGHHDAKLIAKLNDDIGLHIRVQPPRSSYKERPSSAKKVRLEDQMIYCASLYTSHRDEQLAEKAARVIGDDCVVRVAARSSSRGPVNAPS